jgi:hypothetical protein
VLSRPKKSDAMLVFRQLYRSLKVMNELKLLAGWLLLTTCSAAALADTSLMVRADPAPVSIAPQPPSRGLVGLPSITFAVSIETACQGDWIADSLSLSVADTRLSLRAQQIQSGRPNDLVLLVPSKQLAPLAIDNFCVEDAATNDRQAEKEQLLVRHVLSAQASLLCVGSSEQKMTYSSQPLDLLLICARPVAAEAPQPAEF